MSEVRHATSMIVVPPRMCLVTPRLVDELTDDLRLALPGYHFQIVPEYIGRQSHEFFVEADGRVPDAAIERLQAVLARYGDAAGRLLHEERRRESRDPTSA